MNVDETTDAELEQYDRDLLNKVRIATVAVIRSQPSNLSTSKYVAELQNEVQKQWQKSMAPDIFEEELMQFHLKKLANSLAEVLPDSPTVEDDDSPLIPGCPTNNIDSLTPPMTLPDSSAAEKYSTLLKSLVRLKFATETKKTIPFKQVQEFINNAADDGGRENPASTKRLSSSRKFQVSDDSGLPMSEGNSSRPDSVSTSLFKCITHSADTEALIRKTTRFILVYVRSAVFHTPYECHSNWKGSILEKACTILAGSLVDAHCRSEVSSFVETCLDEIWSTDDMSKSFLIDRQLTILSTLCQVGDVCSTALNNVMLKVREFTVEFSTSEPPSLSSVHKVEKIPHFLLFVEILLAWWNQRIQNYSKERSTHPVHVSTDFWKLRPNEGDRSLDKSETLTYSWRKTLQSLSVALVEVHPLINLNLHRTLAALENHCQAPFADDKNSFFGF